jgi:hypothetical protein
MEDSMNEEKIYNHYKRILDKVNKVSDYNDIFYLELPKFDIIFADEDEFIKIFHVFIIEGKKYLRLDYDELFDEIENRFKDLFYINKYADLLYTYLHENTSIKNFMDTLDMDNESFELWFKLNYGG